jgi:hypothetical protein
MYRKYQNYTANVTKSVGKTADYTVLYTDEELIVKPTLCTTLTLPDIDSLAQLGLGSKMYKIVKRVATGAGSRMWVRVVPYSTAQTINGQPDLYLGFNGDEILIQSDPVGKNWIVLFSTIRSFVDMIYSSATGSFTGKLENMSFRIGDAVTTGQANAWEISGVLGAGGVSCTGSQSYTLFRMHAFVDAASGTCMTARAGFIALINPSTTKTPFGGNRTVLELEITDEYTNTAACTTGVITLVTRTKTLSTQYHNLSAYITIRDYHASALGVGALPNIFSFMDANLAWTIPASSEANKTAIFAAHAAGTENVTHYLKFSVAGTSYWIHCDATGPAAS